ncbi:hypothetical protein EOE67_00690 [Rheinheimera riviphila]|uniref:Arc family DNA-binding protein n=1 Tax=Rheinheimera riviphila TaxID=1834037 RepID=A0A437R4P9_9GAMM|nr:hypothetical protein [Rheinheimera riviphila]RVU41749.1 hypothetical protein EOE67_00690 [Rheinheimera riviphila]
MAKKAFALRLDEAMLAALQRWADDEFRSVNGQIEYLLHAALVQNGRQKKSMPEALRPDDQHDQS